MNGGTIIPWGNSTRGNASKGSATGSNSQLAIHDRFLIFATIFCHIMQVDIRIVIAICCVMAGNSIANHSSITLYFETHKRNKLELNRKSCGKCNGTHKKKIIC